MKQLVPLNDVTSSLWKTRWRTGTYEMFGERQPILADVTGVGSLAYFPFRS